MTRANSVVAGVGAIGFGVLTFVATFFVNWPGGGYSESIAKSYVAPGNLPVALTGTLIRLIGVVCLICLLAYLRQAAEESSPTISLVPQIVWAVGLVGAASFGVGWGLVRSGKRPRVSQQQASATATDMRARAHFTIRRLLQADVLFDPPWFSAATRRNYRVG